MQPNRWKLLESALWGARESSSRASVRLEALCYETAQGEVTGRSCWPWDCWPLHTEEATHSAGACWGSRLEAGSNTFSSCDASAVPLLTELAKEKIERTQVHSHRPVPRGIFGAEALHRKQCFKECQSIYVLQTT